MSTKTPNCKNDTAPGNWYSTNAEIARWCHPSGAIIRLRREIPLRDAAACNRGERSDAEGSITVLYHAEPLPSEAEEVHRGGTEQDAREAALEAMNQRPEGE